MKTTFTTNPQWLDHSVALPLATVDSSQQERGRLNHEQLAACENLLGRNLISSSAGTGKTTVLVNRMNRIVTTYPGTTVLMISFTKKAALELQQRIGYRRGVTVCTFHSLAYRILKSAGQEFTLQTNESGLLSSLVKGTDTTVEAVRHSLHGAGGNKETLAVQERYLDLLRKKHIITFDSMQLLALNLLRENAAIRHSWQARFRFILVDEYMDSDAVQVALVELLSEASGNLTVVGDSKQQIYSFRDAVPNVMESFAVGASIYDLNINYRSNPAVLGLANSVMKTDKPLVAAVDVEPCYPRYCTAQDAEDEAKTVTDEILLLHRRGMPYRDMVVIYRSSSAATAIYQELLRRKIPVLSKSNLQTRYGQKPCSLVVRLFRYMMNPQPDSFKDILPLLYLKQECYREISGIVKETGCSFTEAVRSLDLAPFTKRHVDDLTAALESAATLSPARALRRLMCHGFKKFVGSRYAPALDSLLVELEEYPTITAFLSRVEEIQEQLNIARKLATQSDDHVQLMTIHAAKGTEFKTVFLIGAHDGCLPSSRSENLDEEKRLLYVAITRAKEQLFISYPRISENSSYCNQPSRFLREAFAV